MTTPVNEKLCETKHEALMEFLRQCSKTLDLRFEALDKALELKSLEMERRLAGMNELREEVMKDRSQFVRSDMYDVASREFRSVVNRVTIIETRIVAWTSALAVFFLIVQMGIKIFWK